MFVLDFINSVGTFGALCAAIYQLRRGVRDNQARDEERRVERALAMFDEVVAASGTSEAFHRLSVALRAHGSEKHGVSTWHCLCDADLGGGQFLDATHATRDRLFADLYTVMWFFERVETALRYRIVNRDALLTTLGFHFWWWGELLHKLQGPKAIHSLHDLAKTAQGWAAARGELDDWCRRCQTDFGGLAPRRVRTNSDRTAKA